MAKLVLVLTVFLCSTLSIFGQEINRAEYFYDTDPGVGNGVNIPISNSLDSLSFSFNPPTTNLGFGFHQLYVRVKDENGIWGLAENSMFYLFSTTANGLAVSLPINRAEYFYDTDPGVGNGIGIPISTSPDSVSFSFNPPTTNLGFGFHQLYVRVKDENGIWGLAENSMFYLYSTTANGLAVSLPINRAEFFYDTDPGVGNGVNIPISNSLDSLSFSFNPTTTNLGFGFHQLYVRVKDENGIWGIAENSMFYLFDNTVASGSVAEQPQLSRIEYFIDSPDPGHGQGISLGSFTPSDSINSVFPIIIPSTLTGGVHVLSFRVKDIVGKWSIAEEVVITIGGILQFPVTSATVLGINGREIITLNGGNLQMISSYFPSNASSNTLVGWSVSPDSIATISTATGLLQALDNGIATVTGSFGNIFATKIITISGQCITTQIITQPQNTTYTAGNFATLNISAIGSNLRYLWSNGNTSNQFTTTIVGSYQVTVSGTCGVEISNNVNVTRSTNSYLFVPTAINISVGDTVTLDVKTASNAPLEFSINDNTIANISGPTVIGLKAGIATVSVSQPSTPTSDALPVRNIPLNVSSEPRRNFDIIGNNLVPVGTIIIYSQPSVLGFNYSWSFTGVGMQIISGTENTPNFQIVFLSTSSIGTIICVVRDNNQNIVSNKSLRVSTISNEEAESIRNLPKVECPAEVTDCKNAYITSVKIGKLINENTGCSRAGYGDYTTNRKIDTLFMGDSYDLRLGSVAQAGKSSFFAVWLDYNNNGKFTEQDDFLAASFENSATFEIKNLVIKNQDAYAGVRRLRVSMRADAAISPSDPCAKTGGSGETEDYLIYIRKPDDLEAPSFLSPNRDGKNDFFLVRGINPKLPNKLTIMDRLGTLIYEKENYKNDWEAKTEDNKQVQDGTYYYFFSNGEKNIKGFVEIRRK